MIKAVIFDFFGVLCTEGFRLFCDTYFPGDAERRRRAVELVTKHDAGIISKEQYAGGLAEMAGVGVDVVYEYMNDNKPNNLLLDYIRKQLKPNYKISVLSNAGDNYISQILQPADLEMFDDIILSYQHGMVKPQVQIFELAADRLGVLTTECLFIDDSQNHCDGARQTGMKTILYQDFPSFKNLIEECLAAGPDN